MIITVLFGAHRSLEDKRSVTAAISRLVVDALNISSDDIFVALIPVPNESFSFGRGELQLADATPDGDWRGVAHSTCTQQQGPE